MSRPDLRSLSFALTFLLLGAGVAGAQKYGIELAQPRTPQVHVNGTGLFDYLASQGESIDPARDQVVVDLFAASSNFSNFSVQMELLRKQDSTSIGCFNGHDVAPALMEIFPPEAGTGWFAVLTFRSSPVRGVVSLFDDWANLRSQRTYLGADRNASGIYFSRPEGTRYSQDARNPGTEPRVLFFKGTGMNSGAAWVAMETGSSADDDFDDAVLFMEPFSGSLTPIPHTSWGELKARFR